MTRFARAKGSKSSNERLPDEPTPWHVMKQQLEDSTSSKQSSANEKSKSAKDLLKEHDEPYYGDPGVAHHDWAEFEPEKKTSPKKNGSKSSSEISVSKKKKNKLSESAQENGQVGTPKPAENLAALSKKSKKRKSNIPIEDSAAAATPEALNNSEDNLLKKKKKKMDQPLEGSPAIQSESSETKKNKKKKNKLSPVSENPTSENLLNIKENGQSSDKTTVKLSKRQKRNRKNKIKNSEGETTNESKEESKATPGPFNTEGNEWSADVKFGKTKKFNKSTKESPESNDKGSENTSNDRNTNSQEESSTKPFNRDSNNTRDNRFPKSSNRFEKQKVVKPRKPPKIRDDKEHQRRKPHPGATKVIINGMEVEIVMYDGFPVRKEDADRLKDLRKQMVMKGIPKSDINAAMKLERRKAEKALTRIKKNVCFHCRKAGHNLSDCPDLGKEEAATGICFKCGSTEHTHFECRVTKKEEFGFAKCFICREQGHIAKQCPDNPKGLYPDGGACKICGDVTHLKKDCPDLMKEKEEQTLTLDTISNTVETLESEKKCVETTKPKSKIVKF